MAIKQIMILVDDLDGSDADETVSFALDGNPYEIDLNSSHAEELRSILRPYVEAGRKEAPRARTKRRPTRENIAPTTAQVRAWAQAQGITVNNRGRVGAEILAQYEAAH
ncbi:hypothetical protein QFZ36_001541 [Pseudarthrobacter siccitolerans]|uniref:Protein lsr2 n=1 Tax=Pseudarthrobacter siccitolerans TaxID=861266 RepID=A0ABU0PJ45_9MICC|nr:Lsr2 family protein [Pseudarthrobacter siccitolerans]MDQ0673980.1 hypothetical protein [Pseudarthrobacter siccitolerans]